MTYVPHSSPFEANKNDANPKPKPPTMGRGGMGSPGALSAPGMTPTIGRGGKVTSGSTPTGGRGGLGSKGTMAAPKVSSRITKAEWAYRSAQHNANNRAKAAKNPNGRIAQAMAKRRISSAMRTTGIGTPNSGKR